MRRNVREEEGTLGAVDCVTFREVAWKAALRGSSRASVAGRVGRVPRKGSSELVPKGTGEADHRTVVRRQLFQVASGIYSRQGVSGSIRLG
jgi:hypothetical protein